MKDNPLILIVDDELNICTSCEKILKRKGYSSLTSLDGKSALEIS